MKTPQPTTVQNGDYIIVISQEHVGLRHKDGESWSDIVRAMNHLINKLAQAKTQERNKVIEEVMELIAKDIGSVEYKMVASKNIGGQLQFRKGKLDGLTRLYSKIKEMK